MKISGAFGRDEISNSHIDGAADETGNCFHPHSKMQMPLSLSPILLALSHTHKKNLLFVLTCTNNNGKLDDRSVYIHRSYDEQFHLDRVEFTLLPYIYCIWHSCLLF